MTSLLLEGGSSGPNPTALHDRLLMHAIILSGFTAAFFVHRTFFLFTPAVAVVVFLAARRAERTEWAAREAEVMESDLYAPELPDHTRRFVDAAALTLEVGEARRLLTGVVMQSRPLFANRSMTFAAKDEDRVRRSAAELVEAACASALTLQRLDWAVGTPLVAHDPGMDPLAPRELFVSRLVDAAGALRILLLARADQGVPELDRVAELAAELRAEAKARSAAIREVGDLLR